jgi:hypothetical protein
VRWTFGEPPLAQTERAATVLRDVTSRLLALEHDEPAVDQLLADLARAADALDALVPPDAAPRVGPTAPDDGRVYLDHSRDIGAFNPCFPAYELEVEGDAARGRVTFPIAYEGPPGLVHGGFLGLFFDCVVQHHNCDVGVAGKTTSMTIDFRRPTPLMVPLTFALERVVDDNRIRSTGELFDGDRLLCTAAIEAIAGDRGNLPPVSPRRSRQ